MAAQAAAGRIATMAAAGKSAAQPSLFCFGLGYTAGRLAASLAADGWRVSGTRRSAHDTGFAAVEPFSRERPLARPAESLAGVTHLLLSIPPDEKGDPALDLHGTDIAGAASLRWIGYLSTTGVYGDHAGGWVDESTPPQPGSERARRRVAAEEGWRALGRRCGASVHMFRLPGIYGPGRSPFEAIRAGRAHRIDKPGQVFSRIHVDDIVQTLRAAMAHADEGIGSNDAVFNVADDLPAPAHEVTAYACGLLDVQPPPLVPLDEAELSPMGRSFYAENRRVRNDRIKRELGVTLRYPDYRAGLDAILAEEERT